MEYTLDCAVIGSLSDLHAELARLLSFPEYYGANFDALYDCLTDSHASLRILNWDALEEAIGIPKCITFKHILSDAAADSSFTFSIE